MENAEKFTSSGDEIQIQITRQDEDVWVRVSDTGIGISGEHLEKIFEKFERVDSSLSRIQGGTGIGLTLARLFVELHGGRIWAESEGEGKGSLFTFTIPIKSKR